MQIHTKEVRVTKLKNVNIYIMKLFTKQGNAFNPGRITLNPGRAFVIRS